MDELWRDIPNYEGLYQASTKGRIRTCEGKTTRTERHGVRHWKQRILKQKTEKAQGSRGDKRVTLWKDGKPKDHLVARLVALTWVEGFAPNMTVNHIDGDYTNNNIDNLEWLPIGDNIRHGFETGLYPQKRITLKKDGIEVTLRSLAQCDVFLKRRKGYTSNQLLKGKTTLFDDKGNSYVAMAIQEKL